MSVQKVIKNLVKQDIWFLISVFNKGLIYDSLAAINSPSNKPLHVNFNFVFTKCLTWHHRNTSECVGCKCRYHNTGRRLSGRWYRHTTVHVSRLLLHRYKILLLHLWNASFPHSRQLPKRSNRQPVFHNIVDLLMRKKKLGEIWNFALWMFVSYMGMVVTTEWVTLIEQLETVVWEIMLEDKKMFGPN